MNQNESKIAKSEYTELEHIFTLLENIAVELQIANRIKVNKDEYMEYKTEAYDHLLKLLEVAKGEE